MTIYVFYSDLQDNDVFYCTVKLNEKETIVKATHTFQEFPSNKDLMGNLSYCGEFVKYSLQREFVKNHGETSLQRKLSNTLLIIDEYHPLSYPSSVDDSNMSMNMFSFNLNPKQFTPIWTEYKAPMYKTPYMSEYSVQLSLTEYKTPYMSEYGVKGIIEEVD